MPGIGVKKRILKGKCAKTKVPVRDPYRKLTDDEIRLARLCHDEDGMEPSEVAALLRRDKSTMTRLLVMQKDGRSHD